MKKVLIIIAVILVGGGVYLISKGNFCFVKVNGNCITNNVRDNGDKIILQVPIKPGDTQEDIANRIADSIPQISNGFVTVRFITPNQIFRTRSFINGHIDSRDWIVAPDDKGHGLGTIELRDANNKLVTEVQIQEAGGGMENGQLILPFAFDTLVEFSKPSTQNGRLIMYDVNHNTKGPSRALEIPIRFF